MKARSDRRAFLRKAGKVAVAGAVAGSAIILSEEIAKATTYSNTISTSTPYYACYPAPLNRSAVAVEGVALDSSSPAQAPDHVVLYVQDDQGNNYASPLIIPDAQGVLNSNGSYSGSLTVTITGACRAWTVAYWGSLSNPTATASSLVYGGSSVECNATLPGPL